ncbi:aminotransferase class V-fold PLP-dependent enzyme [Blastopirellula sp. JC732]|uniref:Aminotransferase class V-fold PLP-dependent enzyme n=1 Tax=Blastopirellula sediminis TaxID=2894196 RepID=A0A9X1SDM4_9BACT|nr:aminotransferase class V-fold PLP-dependent enzyme [Blastopirellula sediminis]MCC9604280.1 aminotransferase class V-fold PLP-dependent enzyme [Blastopirellula sediminis]MCC9626800.1 aminotransferase class V-fold PLP-dependent enzyme [Blastopirellula sediminis]
MPDFLLDPDVVFLNHGSFGACPRQVFDEYQRWQRELERQPVRFLQRELPGLLADARLQVAHYLGARPTEIVFVPNPTFAANEIARSLPMGPGDEVLMTDHEYGACRFAFQFAAQQKGFRVVEQAIPLPVESNEAIVDTFWQGVTEHTKLIFISQITSPTALTLPVAQICQRAKEAGILTMVDGAHAPGQIDVHLGDLGADFYTATCHKWLCAPKGSGIFYVREDRQSLVEPLVVGWGWGPNKTFHRENEFLEHHEWLGTYDPAAYLAVPAAIAWQKKTMTDEVRHRSQDLARAAVAMAAEIEGIERVHPDSFFRQMGLIDVTAKYVDADMLKSRLYDEYRIEAPVVRWKDRIFVRVSTHAYTRQDHIETLVRALQEI